MATVDDLSTALRHNTGYEAVQKYGDDDQIVLLGRINGSVNDLLIVSHQLQVAALEEEWSHELAKVYVLKGRKLVHGWRVVFEGPSIQETIQSLIKIISKSPKAKKKELDSVELPGGGRHRLPERMGRGAAPLGKALVGPAAILAATGKR